MKNDYIPPASSIEDIERMPREQGQFMSLIVADTYQYRRQHDNRAVKKTLSIPSWLNYEAERANAPFSQLLQQALQAYLSKKSS